MSFVTKKHLPRRTFLRGAGVTLSLPLLESMVPALTALAQTAAAPRLRLGFCFMPHGAVMANWTPAAEGALQLSPILAPLEPFKDQVVVLSNLAHAMAGPQGPGDNGGDHTRCPAVFLNGVHPKRTDGADIHAGTTIDQIAAAKIGQDTLLPSLELAIEDYSGLVGSCDVGFSCTYMNTISWRTPTAPMPMEINPRVVFDRMFGDGATAEERRRRIETQRSILDAVTEPGPASAGRAGSERSESRGRLSRYRAGNRTAHRDLAEKQASENLDVPVTPRGIPDDFVEHTKLMFDLMTIAFQADITRISTFMMAREVSYRTFPMLGISEAFHPASHHQNNAERLAQLTKIQTFHVGFWSYLLEKLRGNARRRRQPARSLAAPVRRRDEQQQRSQSRAAADCRRGRSGRHDEGRTSSQLPGKHADGEPAADDSQQGRHSAGQRRRQHRAAVGAVTE